MSKDVRPFEEYKEMIQDMRKEEMIKGLYDLSKNVIEKENEIEKLNKCIKDDKENADEIIVEQQKEIERLHSIIKEVREYATQHMMELAKRKGINGEENGAIYVAVADLLEILDKENIE